MGERYVVVRRAAGLGDILLTTMAAWAYAAATGRRLVIDWRFTQYTTDPTENLFPLVFEPLDEWGGLGVDHEVPGGVRTASSWYPQGWSADRLDAPRSYDAVAGRASSRFGLELIKHGGDVDADVVVFDACLADVAPAPTVARALLQELRLRPTVQSAIDRETTRWGSGPVIGLHVRHGNGGAIMGHARWWTDPAVAIERIVAVVEEVRAAVGKWPVYLATDSRGAELMLRARIPGLIVRPNAIGSPMPASSIGGRRRHRPGMTRSSRCGCSAGSTSSAIRAFRTFRRSERY